MGKVLQSGQRLHDMATLMDRGRAWILGRTMRIPVLRRIYSNCSLRLAVTFLLLTIFYLPISLRHPEILLAVGPFLSGYMHLIASYWFIQSQTPGLTFHTRRIHSIHLFTGVTLFSVAAQWLVRRYELMPEMPFGTWEVLASVIALIVIRSLFKSLKFFEIAACIVLYPGILHYAWQEPILFVGAILILHNWVAFIYWILVAKGQDRKTVAVAASIIFGVIHYLVLSGAFDPWLPVAGGEAFPGGQEITGWYLASWSNDPVVWYRALVVYAFGISLHYFVWLKAIPESMNKSERPNGFRTTLSRLRQDIGSDFLILGTSLIGLGMILWSLSFAAGQSLYFAIAALHGWLELAFLLRWLYTRRVRQTGLFANLTPVQPVRTIQQLGLFAKNPVLTNDQR